MIGLWQGITNIKIERFTSVHFFSNIVPIYTVVKERAWERRSISKKQAAGPRSIRMIECLKGCTKMSPTRLIKAWDPKGRRTTRTRGPRAKSRWWDRIFVGCLLEKNTKRYYIPIFFKLYTIYVVREERGSKSKSKRNLSRDSMNVCKCDP